MIKQAVNDMGGLARCRWQKLGVERREPVGDMGIDRDRRISTVAGIDAADRLAWAADMGVLAIRTRGGTAAEGDRRIRL